LYDGYRIDHLVGFYRTFSRPLLKREGTFDPPHQHEQLALGERLMGIFTGCGARIIAEDLGVVPDFVRESLTTLGIPGYRVFRWERDWNVPGEPFRNPARYPALSVATTGTHDTDPIAAWWDTAAREEREAFARLPQIAPVLRGGAGASAPFTPALRDAILRALYTSAADLLLIPIQDVFGWTDRINTPATVTSDNWTWRLPWPVDALADQPLARERAGVLRGWAEETGRIQDVLPMHKAR
jgi:4-alpha-glucanotransferase